MKHENTTPKKEAGKADRSRIVLNFLLNLISANPS